MRSSPETQPGPAHSNATNVPAIRFRIYPEPSFIASHSNTVSEYSYWKTDHNAHAAAGFPFIWYLGQHLKVSISPAAPCMSLLIPPHINVSCWTYIDSAFICHIKYSKYRNAVKRYHQWHSKHKNRQISAIDSAEMFCYYVPNKERYRTFKEEAYNMVKQNRLCYNVENLPKVRMLCDVRARS